MPSRELAIVKAKRPEASAALAREVVAFVQALRGGDLFKSPGVAETLDWVSALHELDSVTLDPQTVNDTLGVLLKYQDDIVRMEGSEAKRILDQIKDEIRTTRMRPACRDGASRRPGKLAANIMHFARVLRGAGLPVGPASVIDALDAALSGSLRTREEFYWTLHAIFVKRREHKEIFDQAFHVFWKKPKMLEQLMQLHVPADHPRRPATSRRSRASAGWRKPCSTRTEAQSRREEKPDALELDATFTASADDILRAKDFEQMTLAEQMQAKEAIARLRLQRREVLTRRFQPDPCGRAHRYAADLDGNRCARAAI